MTAGSVSILCVDDEPLALEHLKCVLSAISADCPVRYFGSPPKAVDAQIQDPADIVISDLKMGTTTGLEVIAEMQAAVPNSIYMLLSGEADLKSALQAMNNQRVFKFFTKPIEREELRQGLMEAVTELNLRRLHAISGASLEAVSKMGAPVAFLDLDGRLIFSNKSAEALFADSDVFDLSQRPKFFIRNRQDHSRFKDRLHKSGGNDDAHDEKCVIQFSRPGSTIPISVSVLYCQAEPASPAYFSLVFSDPARKNITSAEAIAAALDLTPSEARIVYGLAEGANVEQAAKMAGVSLSTARTYIKNVFSKTGVSRQAELVRLALLSVA